MKEYIGIEIGGTKQQAASFNERGETLRVFSERVKLTRGAPDILDWLDTVVPELITERTVAVGVGFGGIVDSRDGTSFCSVHVDGWDKFPLKTYFAERFGLPVTVVNDTVCGGYAEYLYGAGRGVARFFYTNIGTGCGGGMFIDGKSYDGIGTGGAYHGQIYVPSPEKDGSPIRMEQLCAGPAIEARLRKEGYVPESSLLYTLCEGKRENLTCKDWGRAIWEKDPFALAELERWAESYAVALSTLITVMAPTRVAIGGGVSLIGAPLFDAIRRHTDEKMFVSMKWLYEIVPCETEEMAVLIGAAMYARDGFSVV
ncbi:MAG: ROK family protein [Clostridia bacterium]|nr:ROK family protein [Clostridia bacterium]